MWKKIGKFCCHKFGIGGLFNGKSRMSWLIQRAESLKFDTDFPNVLKNIQFLILSKGFLDGSEIEKTTFRERLKILEKEGKITNKQSKKGITLPIDPSYNPLLVFPVWNYKPKYLKF